MGHGKGHHSPSFRRTTRISEAENNVTPGSNVLLEYELMFQRECRLHPSHSATGEPRAAVFGHMVRGQCTCLL
jgi:hypothetical protein